MDSQNLFIGLMSGTSMDGIDALLVAFNNNTARVLHHTETAIPDDLRSDLLALCQPGDDHIDLLGRCDHALGELFAHAVIQLMSDSNTRIEQIRAIGSHGQTVRHRPPQKGEQHPFSLQIGDPNIIAARTGITTVADFRRRDLALGGQGAPLVPAFHRAMFAKAGENRAVLNLGGIANVTWLNHDGSAKGFDTGPANLLMDAWCQQHYGTPFDFNGEWATTGIIQLELLKRLMTHPFLAQSPPKSTGREDFNTAWLEHILEGLGNRPAPADTQATLLEFTARSAADVIKAQGQPDAVYLCGGGALNTQLRQRLGTLLNPAEVSTTESLGIPPKLVEAAAFAWLAKQTLDHLPGNLPAATGAAEEAILGGIYLA